jgi:YHS domain-containing protein
MKRTLLLTAYSIAITASTVFGQTIQSQHDHAGHNHAMPGIAKAEPTMVPGPHGGSLKQTGNLQIETIVSQGGLQMFVYDESGKAVSVDRCRGAVSVRVEGNAKRYRYDLLPDGKGALTAPVNLSQLAGRQIDVDVQLVGITSSTVSFNEVASVPASEQQLAAAAIARQKICPVSGKPLGSMGDPVAVEVNGQKLFVCCAGCVNAVESDPAKYAAGRPKITVTSATQADTAAISAQKVCPVMDEPLGSMGDPIKVMVGDRPVFLCCKGCIKKIKADPAKYLAMVYGSQTWSEGDGTEGDSVPAGTEQVREGIFKVTAADAPFIAAQKKCPVMDEPLDSMGGPYKVNAAGKAIYICCPGCAKKIAAEPQKYLATLKSQGVEAPLLR